MKNLNIKKSLQDLKFIRKIQLGFLAVAMASTFIAVNDFIKINRFEDDKEKIFNEFIIPKDKIDSTYIAFQKAQFLMMKISNRNFASDFSSNYGKFEKLKSSIDYHLLGLKEVVVNEKFKDDIKKIDSTWTEYKVVVADAIISAAATKDYEMASVIAVTSGEEVGEALVKEFDDITTVLSNQVDAIDEQFSEDVASTKTVIIVSMAVGAIIFLIITLVVAPVITKPITKLKEIVYQYSLGDFEHVSDISSKDEIGELADMMRKLRESQIEKTKAAEKIVSGIFEKIVPASDKDTLSHAFNKEISTLDELMIESRKLIEASKKGNLSVRAAADKFSGSWKEVVEGINSIVESFVSPIHEAGSVLDTMANGDFTRRMTGNYEGDYETMKDNVNQVVDSMNEVIGRILESISALSSAASQISASTEEMAAGAGEQTNQTEDVASAIEEMTKTILESTQNASNAAKTAEFAGVKANEGGKVVLQTIDGINRIAEVVISSSNTMKELGVSSDQIGEIIQVINEIAEQTNLLALNAAIEAARAGEQGRGFAVVADEVRKLAERTTKATKEIEVMIKQIQRDTSGAIKSIENGTKEVEKGKTLAQEAGNSLSEIIGNSRKLAEIIAQLAVASEEQSKTSEQISKSVDAINKVTQQSAIGVEQISHTAEDLYRLTENLQSLVAHFKLEHEKHVEKGDKKIAQTYAVSGGSKLRKIK